MYPITDNFVDNEQVQIDFKPLYQCIHIYDVMDMREQLQANYQDDRRVSSHRLVLYCVAAWLC